MAETYSLPTSSLGKISRWMNARRAAGRVVQPWELEAAYEAEMNALANKATTSRGLTLQAESNAQQAARDAESRRMNDINTELRKDEIKAAEKGSMMSGIGNLATMALAGKAMLGKGAAEKGAAEGPGLIRSGWDTVSKLWKPTPTATPVEAAVVDLPAEAGGAVGANVLPASKVLPASTASEAAATTGGTTGTFLATAPITESAAGTADAVTVGMGDVVSGLGPEGASVSGAALPLAYIAGAEIVRNLLGGPGKTYGDKSTSERIFDSPGTAGVMAQLAPGALFAKDHTTAGRAMKNMSAIERTAMAPIDYVFGDKDAFDKDTLKTAGYAFLNPFGDAKDPSTASLIANTAINPLAGFGNAYTDIKNKNYGKAALSVATGGLSRVFCFVAGTPMVMADGGEVAVEDVDLKDKMLEGGAVTACGKALTDNLYNYRGIRVEGSHAVFEDGAWKRVQDCDRAEKIDGQAVVYPVANENHLIVIRGMVFSDMIETPLGWDATETERLEWLNAQTKRNRDLKRRYADQQI